LNFNKLQQLIILIESETTDKPRDFSIKLEVSERMMYRYLKILKHYFIALIKYSKTKVSYYFTEEGSFGFELATRRIKQT